MERNELALQPGMTFTVEAGIYLPGRGGVRIGEKALVSEYGCEAPTTLPRELTRLYSQAEADSGASSPERWLHCRSGTGGWWYPVSGVSTCAPICCSG